MKISEYIHELEKIMKEHGDLPVERSGSYGRRAASMPCLAYRKILLGRDSKPEFYHDWDPIERRGDKIACV